MSNDGRTTDHPKMKRIPGPGRRPLFPYKATQIILLFFSVLEGLIALRILLKLIGANPLSPVVSLIYGITTLFLVPFAGLIRSPATDGMVLEISSMFAIVVYALTALMVEKIITLFFPRPRSPVSNVSETTTGEQHPSP